MPTPRENRNWSSIRAQLSEVQRYLLDGQYREAVITDREILRTLVRMQMNDACLVSTDLNGDIEQLFENRVISAEAREHYHRVNQLAEQAAGGAVMDAIAANNSFNGIRQELSDYVEQSQRAQSSRAEARSEESSEGPQVASRYAASSEDRESGNLDIPVRRRNPEERERVRSTRNPSRSTRNSGHRSGERSGRVQRSSSNRNGHRGGRRPSRYQEEENVRELDIYTILKIVIPVFCLILLVLLIRVLFSGGKAEIQTTAAPTVAETTVAVTEPEPTEPETTEPETTEAPKKWTTTDGVRVRTKPSTTDSEVLTVLDPGTELQYKGEYDADWIIIDYNGQEAYVAKAYTKSEEIS